MQAPLQATPFEPAQWTRRGPVVAAEGNAILMGVDQVAREMEAKWGIDRLPLLAPDDLRRKFERQRVLWNEAVWLPTSDLPDLEREGQRMINAWRALDHVATVAGFPTAADLAGHVPTVEVRLPDGDVAVIVADQDAAVVRSSKGRQVWTASEVGRVLAAFPAAVKAKDQFAAVVIDSKPPRSAIVPDDEIPF